MKLTATTLIPAILTGGAVLGLLAATEVNTRMHMAPEPEWRVAAREAATNAVSYAFVDSGPSDLSPYLPWIGTGPEGSVAMFPEDFHRAAAEPLPADFGDMAAELALAEAAIAPAAPDHPRAMAAVERSAARAQQTVADLRGIDRTANDGQSGDGRPRVLSLRAEPIKIIEPAVVDGPMPQPMFDAAPEDDRLGG